MSTGRDGVNPLRPYYIPPTIGDPAESSPIPSSNPFSSPKHAATANSKYASKARDMFSDLDYNNYLGEQQPSMIQGVKELVDELIWKYTSVLMAQPFEVAKTILQVKNQDENAALLPAKESHTLKPPTGYGNSIYDYPDSDSDDEPAYFTSNVPSTPTPSHPRGHAESRTESPLRSPRSRKPTATPDHYLELRRPDSILDVIGQLWSKEGAWGVWKGSNATFLYTVLQSLLENWSRSFLSAILNVPDLGVKDDIDRLIDIASPYPWASLLVAAAAAVTTGVVLSPLDLVRTRLITTPIVRGQRRTIATLRALPTYLCPSPIMVPTVLHSLVHPILTLSTPLLLRTRFMIDSHVSPMTFSVAKFFASSAAVLVKLPLETVLRRGQMSVLSTPEFVRALSGKDQRFDTSVPIGRYNGVYGTMHLIATQEGSREVVKEQPQKKGKAKSKAATAPMRKKGQGLDGLWRGWKVNWWGLVGLWTASVVGNGGEGEF